MTLWSGKKPDVSHLRVFGCLAYVLVDKKKRKGLASHTEKCIFIGYPAEKKGWVFYNPETRKIIINNVAQFDERYFPALSKSNPCLPPPPPPPAQPERIQLDVPDQVGVRGGNPAPPPEPPSRSPSPPPSPSPSPAGSLPPLPPSPNPSRSPSPPPQSPPPSPPRSPSPEPIRRTARPNAGKPPGEWWRVAHKASTIPGGTEEAAYLAEGDPYWTIPEGLEFAHYEACCKVAEHDDHPKTYAQAMLRPDAAKYHEAAVKEIESLIENGTWELCKLPPGHKAIGSRWVFRIKHNSDGSIERYKARLVAQGFSMRPGFDFDETFAPTCRWAALRAIIALAALEDMHMESVDVSSAFVQAELDKLVFMKQPEGFPLGEPDDVLGLLKGIYGLKQASRIWHQKLHQVLTLLGFVKVKSDHSIWVYEKDGVRIIVPVFVDDLTLVSKSREAIQKLKVDLAKHIKIRDLGPTEFLLGVRVERDRAKRTIHLSQRQYAVDILKRYGLENCNPVKTPLPSVTLSKSMCPSTDEEREEMRHIPYVHAVGSIMYLAVSTRPDLAHGVGVLGRFSSNPGMQHWQAVKHMLRYIKGTLDMKLTYAPTPNPELFVTYSDSDHAGCPDTRRSTSGYVITIGGGAVSWRSALQLKSVNKGPSLSSTEAEYVAAVEAGKEVLWMRSLLGELGFDVPVSSTMHMDNQSAQAVAKNPEHHGRMKHIELRLHWLREIVDAGDITIKHLPTFDMPADALTKNLPFVSLDKCRRLMGLTTVT